MILSRRKKDKQTPTQYQDGRGQLRKRETSSQESEEKGDEEGRNHREIDHQAKILRSPSKTLDTSQKKDDKKKNKDSSTSESESGRARVLRSSSKITYTPAKKGYKVEKENISKSDENEIKVDHIKRYFFYFHKSATLSSSFVEMFCL